MTAKPSQSKIRPHHDSTYDVLRTRGGEEIYFSASDHVVHAFARPDGNPACKTAMSGQLERPSDDDRTCLECMQISIDWITSVVRSSVPPSAPSAPSSSAPDSQSRVKAPRMADQIKDPFLHTDGIFERMGPKLGTYQYLAADASNTMHAYPGKGINPACGRVAPPTGPCENDTHICPQCGAMVDAWASSKSATCYHDHGGNDPNGVLPC